MGSLKNKSNTLPKTSLTVHNTLCGQSYRREATCVQHYLQHCNPGKPSFHCSTTQYQPLQNIQIPVNNAVRHCLQGCNTHLPLLSSDTVCSMTNFGCHPPTHSTLPGLYKGTLTMATTVCAEMS